MTEIHEYARLLADHRVDAVEQGEFRFEYLSEEDSIVAYWLDEDEWRAYWWYDRRELLQSDEPSEAARVPDGRLLVEDEVGDVQLFVDE